MIPSKYAELPESAQRLLKAARHLMLTSGFDALTLEAVGREAGERKSLIWYYFGGKPGLLVALADWLLVDILRTLRDEIGTLQHEERLEAIVRESRRIATDVGSNQAFFELLPHLLRDRQTRDKLASLYETYRQMLYEGIASDASSQSDPRIRAVASMTIALGDGLAIQLLADPGSVDISFVLKQWEQVLRQVAQTTTAEAKS